MGRALALPEWCTQGPGRCTVVLGKSLKLSRDAMCHLNSAVRDAHRLPYFPVPHGLRDGPQHLTFLHGVHHFDVCFLRILSTLG